MLSKHDLREAMAPTNRGIAASENDRKAIARIIAHVEDLNPTPAPLLAPALLAGDWRLLYTTSRELLGIDRVPLAQLGNIYQCVRPDQSRIYNIAEINSLPYCEALVSVVAGFEVAKDSSQSSDDPNASGGGAATGVSERLSERLSERRVNVKFNRGVIGLQRVLGYQSPAQYIKKLEETEKLNFLQGLDFSIKSDRQQGWLEITYLDEDLRISRGNQGSLFVLTK